MKRIILSLLILITCLTGCKNVTQKDKDSLKIESDELDESQKK